MNTVWTIAGSDSGGGAGIQADLHTFQDFKVQGCSAITALTAQNTRGVSHIQATSPENLSAQIQALRSDLKPSAIKLGMLYDPELVRIVADEISSIGVPIIADPVLVSTSGTALYASDFISAYQDNILSLCTLLTPNIHEAAALTGISIHTHDDMARAASILLSQGVRAVFIKGGDLSRHSLASDYYADNQQSFWINQDRIPTQNTHGTGCTLAAAIAAGLALDWSLIDSIVLAKAYVHAGLTQATHAGIGHVGIDYLNNHFPWITDLPASLPEPFLKITQPIGRYPIVDNLDDLSVLCTKGISFIQLRIKNPGKNFEEICARAFKIANSFNVHLIVNDCTFSSGAHLGQEDLSTSGVPTERNTLLGLSAHNLFELAKAYAHHPSYLAIGPIFKTNSKQINYPEIGLDKLKFIAALSPLPLVAIGGIKFTQFQEILNLGCSGVAFINAAQDLMNEGRFDRHFSLPDFNFNSQQQLAQAKIVCVGAGGLASGFLPYLAAAGVGEITLIDDDTVSYSNLQRQVIFKESDIGTLKVEAAQRYLSALNSHIKINVHAEKLTIHNAPELLKNHDLILDGTDNFDAHYLINDTARYLKTDLICASVFQDQGQLFYLSAQSACYRCIFPEAPPVNERPNCNIAGVLGTTPGMMGMMQAQLAIEWIASPRVRPGARNDGFNSFCRTVNMKTWQVKNFNLSLASDCPACHTSLSLNTLRSMHMSNEIPEMSVQELKEALNAGKKINLLDVREDEERADFNMGGAHIPIQELPERINELDDKLDYVVYCARGGRSSMACKFLADQGFKVTNLAGGAMGYRALSH